MVAALALLGAALGAFVPVLHAGDAVPALPLVDQQGRRFTLADLRGDVVVIGFLYTSCGDADECPLVGAKFGRMQRALGDAPIRLVTLTLDAAHDTPGRMRAFGATYGADAARWKLATGAPADVDELVARFGVTSLPLRARRGFVHDEEAVILDRAGRVAAIVPGNRWSAADLLAIARTDAGAPVDLLTTVRLLLSAAAERCGGAVAPFSVAAALGVFALALLAVAFAFARAFRTPAP